MRLALCDTSRRAAAVLGALLITMLTSCSKPATVEREHGHAGGEHGHDEGAHAAHDEEGHGRVVLVPAAITAGGIVAGAAGPRVVEETVETPGEVRLDADRVVQVRPRFPGVARRMARALGDRVRGGDLLAVIHSNESLADYEVRAPRAGTIIAREIAAGQVVDHESVLYTIADLSTVWVDFALYPQLAGRVHPGQPVWIRSEADRNQIAAGKISYVGPLLEQDTRVSYGRVVLPNAGGRWQPGLFVTAIIAVARVEAAVAVPEAAIVRMPDGPAVFRVRGTTFEARHVTPGRSDGAWTEIREGLAAGDSIVFRNAYLLKAELGSPRPRMIIEGAARARRRSDA